MIGKNFEVIPVFTVSNEKTSAEYDYLDYIDKKKKNGNGEDINIRMLNFFPDLDTKNMLSKESMAASTVRNNSGLSVFEMMQSIQKRQTILISTPEIKESDIQQEVVTTLSNSRMAAAGVSAENISGNLTHIGDDETREQATEIVKIHSTPGQLKSDFMSHRKELQIPDMKPRTVQLPITDRIFQANVSELKERVAPQKQSLNLDYPFLRWSGEHSVKVSIPVDLSHVRHLTLLPSDPRVAEMLSRQMSQVNYTTELLHPQQGDEESERHHTQQDKEEEQE